MTRMIERNISRNDVFSCMRNGTIIEKYIETNPYPAFLIMGRTLENIPLHIVASFDEYAENVHVITAYIPDLEHFLDDFKTRRGFIK